MSEEKKKKNLPIPVENSGIDLLSSISDSINPMTGINMKILDPDDLTKDFMIIMLAKDENRFGIAQGRYRVIKRDGEKLILEPYDEKGPEEAREQIANFIVQINEKQIKESSIAMVKKALLRKPIKQLHRLKEESKKKGIKSKLATKVGCVYLEIGDEKVLL